MHGWGAATYNWNCGSEFYDTSGCDGESEYAVNNMPESVEMIYSDIGDEVTCQHRGHIRQLCCRSTLAGGCRTVPGTTTPAGPP